MALVWSGHVAADECRTGNWVALAFDGDAWISADQEKVVEQVAAGLAPHGIHACVDAGGGERPLARVSLAYRDAQHVAVTVQVQDAVTSKRVARDVELMDLGGEAKALAVAVAADELLRASWAELALTTARPIPAPPAIRAAVEQRIARPASAPPGRLEVRGDAAVDAYSGGQVQVGGDLGVRCALGPRWSVEGSIGWRRGLSSSTPLGIIDATTVIGGADVAAWVLRGPQVGVALLGGAYGGSLTFVGQPRSGEVATTVAGGMAGARLGVQLRVLLGRSFAVDARLRGAIPLLSGEAMSSRGGSTSVGGVGLHAALGVTGVL